ncbi:MAG: ArsR family transcriptional regulator [bacterium]
MKAPALAPTLWRTCRVLACPRRLEVLRCVIGKGSVCVKEVARICRMPENTATQYLRALQARGLLVASRQSRWVYYVPRADPSVQHAQLLLDAMRRDLAQRETCENSVAALTAFTHPRRIAIVRCLNSETMPVDQMAQVTGMSLPACYRHMAKLVSRGVVVVGNDSVCKLLCPAPGLATTLLQAALE